jgi:hypothetical protein
MLFCRGKQVLCFLLESLPSTIDFFCIHSPCSVTVRKDDAPAAVQAAISNVAGFGSSSAGGGLIHTTSG